MITIDKVKFWEKNRGSLDTSYRAGNMQMPDPSIIKDWNLISEFYANLYLIKQGLVAKPFEEEVERKIKENCDNQETRDYLYRISNWL